MADVYTLHHNGRVWTIDLSVATNPVGLGQYMRHRDAYAIVPATKTIKLTVNHPLNLDMSASYVFENDGFVLSTPAPLRLPPMDRDRDTATSPQSPLPSDTDTQTRFTTNFDASGLVQVAPLKKKDLPAVGGPNLGFVFD
jgi:hypothetical protein